MNPAYNAKSCKTMKVIIFLIFIKNKTARIFIKTRPLTLLICGYPALEAFYFFDNNIGVM